MEPTDKKLINIAKKYMVSSKDPSHDLGHVERVVFNTTQLSNDLGLNTDQRQIVILAAWWHDVGRTVIKSPSVILLSFFDDIISSYMLLKEAKRLNVYNKNIKIAIKIILCKTLGTGIILTKILLNKKNRLLFDILEDADNLDIMHLGRIKRIHFLIDKSIIYNFEYKILMRWHLGTNLLLMRTKVAKKYAHISSKKFITWIKKKRIKNWHTKHFGLKWVKQNIHRSECLLKKIKLTNIQKT